jgi:hypothetical protein
MAGGNCVGAALGAGGLEFNTTRMAAHTIMAPTTIAISVLCFIITPLYANYLIFKTLIYNSLNF